VKLLRKKGGSKRLQKIEEKEVKKVKTKEF